MDGSPRHCDFRNRIRGSLSFSTTRRGRDNLSYCEFALSVLPDAAADTRLLQKALCDVKVTTERISMDTLPVDLAAIQEARRRILNVAYRTPLYFSPGMSALTKSQVYLKLETHQPIRVFKIRGAANKMLKFSEEERRRGVVAASSGNHGLAVSYIAQMIGSKATIVVPTNAVEEKVRAIE